MCSSERQAAALQAVAYDADATWINGLSSYQRANMGLYLRARHVNALASRWSPRTVRDSIPESKLAQYANYEYNEARELSYSPMVISFQRLYESFDPDEPKEPWMLEDVDDLLFAFLSMGSHYEPCTEHDDLLLCRKDYCERSYESPFLHASNFEEMVLKLKTVSMNIKKLWDVEYFPFYDSHPQARAEHLVLFKAATCQIFAALKEDEGGYLENLTEAGLAQIKTLTRSLKDQNTWIFKKQSTRSWLEPSTLDLSGNRRLYSAVLQGASPAPEGRRSETGTETSASDLRFVRATAPTGSPPMFTWAPPSYAHYHLIPPPGSFLSTRLMSNNLLSSGVLNFRHINCLPLLLQNATAPSFFGCQRGPLPSYLPQRPPPVLVQPSIKISRPPMLNLLPVTSPSFHYRQPRVVQRETPKLDSIGAELDEPFVPVTGVPSEELELQALEQYAASNTNVFQELERQAAEQYETSENWRSPPEYYEFDEDCFGGCTLRGL